MRLVNGATISFEYSWASNIEEKEKNFYKLIGTEGGIDYSEGKLKIITEMNDICTESLPDMCYEPVLNEFEHFIECIQKGVKPYSPPEDAVKLMKIIDAIYMSAESKNEIVFNS